MICFTAVWVDEILLYCFFPALLLNVDGISVHIKPPSEIRTQNESIGALCEISSIAVSLPKIKSKCLTDILAMDECYTTDVKKHDFLANLILKPWSMKTEIAFTWHRSNSFRNRPFKCLKVDSENISFNVSPAYIDKLSQIASPYIAEYCARYCRIEDDVHCVNEVIESESYRYEEL